MSSHVHVAHSENQGHAGGHGAHHIVPAKMYWLVYAGLMVLTVVTVGAYYLPDVLSKIAGQPVDLGAANVVIAMAIATCKASLVCLFFMQLKYDKKFNLIAFLSSLIFLGLFLGFTLMDIKFRTDPTGFLQAPSSAPNTAPVNSGQESPKGTHGNENPAPTGGGAKH
ncbi:MAG TPA: cytochrome C oxidase subunit IV family protein [Blastocatellia bacterium]|nr:cytochrome C oxidase subunit IV family protein [Blastocatellia bacterium]